MTKRKIALYIYDSDTKEFKSYTVGMTLERQIIDMESRNEHERVYAVNASKKIRFEIADRPDEVFHNHDNHTYSVWYDKPDYYRAIDAIGNYILDHIAPVIRDSKSFLERLQEKKLAAIKLLEGDARL